MLPAECPGWWQVVDWLAFFPLVISPAHPSRFLRNPVMPLSSRLLSRVPSLALCVGPNLGKPKVWTRWSPEPPVDMPATSVVKTSTDELFNLLKILWQ